MNRLVTHPGPTAYEVYAGLLAHELRTPAAALQMAAHVLARQGVLEDPLKRREWVEMVGMAAERLARTVTELTEFSAITGGHAPAGAPGSAANLADIAFELAEGRPLSVEVSVEAAAFPVDADRLRLVLQALLDNAYRFGRPGRPVQVHGATIDNPTRLVVRVVNEGDPIPDAVRAKVFEPFVQAEQGSARSHQGLGLGLTIARRAAEGAGGSVVLEPGQPTTLRLELPLYEDGLTQYLRGEVRQANQQALRAVEDWRSQLTMGRAYETPEVFSSAAMRVLLVTNDDDQSELVRSLLAASTTPRVQVERTSSGWQAQQHVRVGAHQALVVDDQLSDSDGETLVARLRAMGVRTPALFLTSAEHLMVAHGVDDYLPKAEMLQGNSLVRALVALVRRHDLTEQLAAARDQAARTTSALAELAHDLASPLGVVLGVTHVLLSEDNGLNAEGRSCLEDVSHEARRAAEILERSTSGEPQTSSLASSGPVVASLKRATVSGPGARMVLIADDDPATRRLVSATLASDQYSVLEAADGEEAWRLIREHHPAVAILDWQMPVYSGLELSDAIKGDPQVGGMTVIMLTGRSAPADREAGARARADLYLTKPFSPQELLGAVEQALGVH
jgi:signal transduction histidine kinase